MDYIAPMAQQLKFMKVLFVGNIITNDDGGGIYVDNGGLYVENSVIQKNYASSQGGGVYAFYNTTNNGFLSLKNTLITDNVVVQESNNSSDGRRWSIH